MGCLPGVLRYTDRVIIRLGINRYTRSTGVRGAEYSPDHAWPPTRDIFAAQLAPSRSSWIYGDTAMHCSTASARLIGQVSVSKRREQMHQLSGTNTQFAEQGLTGKMAPLAGIMHKVVPGFRICAVHRSCLMSNDRRVSDEPIR